MSNESKTTVGKEKGKTEIPTKGQVKEYLKQKNLRLISVKTPDGHSALNVIQQGDRAIKIARNRMLQPGYEPDRIIPLLKQYREALAQINDVSKQLSEICNIEYHEPKMFSESD